MFYLKKNLLKKDEPSSIMGRIQIGKTMSQFSLKLKANIKLWDTKAGRMIGKSSHALEINSEINRINLIIHTRYKELLEINTEVDAHYLKNTMQGIASSQDTVLGHFRQMKETIAQRVGIDYSEAASEQYLWSYKALENFIRKKLKLSDIPFKSLTYSFIEEYYQYLRVDKKFSIGTSGIYQIYLRKVVRSAVNQGILFRDPFNGFESETAEVVHKSLTREELDKFISVEPSVKQQKRTKDIFLFACFTGISYIDMKNLKYDDIKTAEDGSRWIIAKRQKTKVKYQVRLLDIPLAIIEKYRGQRTDGKIFITPRNTTIHAGLNAMAKKCGITKTLGIHVARHTWATTVCLSNGVPIETLSRTMGHKKISTTQIYAKITGQKINEDMQALEQRLGGKYQLSKIQIA